MIINLNDREQQVCMVGLQMFLDHLTRHAITDFSPANQHDIMTPGHSKAYVITAMKVLSGNIPIPQAGQTHPAVELQKEIVPDAQHGNIIIDHKTKG